MPSLPHHQAGPYEKGGTQLRQHLLQADFWPPQPHLSQVPPPPASGGLHGLLSKPHHAGCGSLLSLVGYLRWGGLLPVHMSCHLLPWLVHGWDSVQDWVGEMSSVSFIGYMVGGSSVIFSFLAEEIAQKCKKKKPVHYDKNKKQSSSCQRAFEWESFLLLSAFHQEETGRGSRVVYPAADALFCLMVKGLHHHAVTWYFPGTAPWSSPAPPTLCLIFL